MADLPKPVRLSVERATEADLPAIMAIERLPGYDQLVGRWDEARHRAAFAEKRYAYFVARDGDEVLGFCIVRDWASADRVTLIQRLAVRSPGHGHGSAFLRGLIDTVFQETEAHRLWIGLFPENVRARRAYEGVGFQPEGIARGNVFFGGVNRDELIMSMLRPEWREGSR